MNRPEHGIVRFVPLVAIATASLAAASLAASALIGPRDQNAKRETVAPAAVPVIIKPDESAKRVDISIGGEPFTSYRWDEQLKKPVLYPLRSARGTVVTRGWPLDPRAGERVDHPHHVGLWFNYGDVNGLDFWNNSDAIPPDQAPKMGTIRHERIVKAEGGAGSGTLIVAARWTNARGEVLLHEDTTYVFRGGEASRTVDRVTTLSAPGQRVVFNDNKEGVFGLRVARQLELPSKTAEVFTDASGRPTTVPALDNAGVTGMYTSSEGKKGDDVWGTRGRWTMLTGRIGERPVTVAILDHPSNPGYPTHWHARGYGLFAANPLGHAALSEGREPAFNLPIDSKSPVTFRYRVVILDAMATPDAIEREARAFAGQPTSDR
jgi:methane monooxygenase PmoA-like